MSALEHYNEEDIHEEETTCRPIYQKSNMPTSTPKVWFQWTQPVCPMLNSSVTTVTIKPLVSDQGRKGFSPDTKMANRKKV